MRFWNATKIIVARILSITVIPIVLGFILWGVAYVMAWAGQVIMKYLELAWLFVCENWKAMIIVLIIVAASVAIFEECEARWTARRKRREK